MSYDIYGRWKAGWALDIHTLSSKINYDGSFDNVRSEIGEALYSLKYCNNFDKIDFLTSKVVDFLNTRHVTKYIDVIIPVPPSILRDLQPVYKICENVGKSLNINVDTQFIKKVRETTQLKSIDNPQERRNIIDGAFKIEDSRKYRNKKVLIIDDLYRSGTTLNEICNILYEDANVQNVYVVTLTKTRVKK